MSKPYKVIEKPLSIPKVDASYTHFYGNPFLKKEWTFDEVMDGLAATAGFHCLAFEETWAYSYAIKQFGASFFDKNIIIIYEYESKEAYDEYGVAKISWKYKNGSDENE